MTTTPQKIGFIGLGIMGAPMAGHLLDAGHQLFVNTQGNTPEPFISKAKICASAAEVARQADIIFIMVPDTPDVEKVLFGEPGTHGVAEGLKDSRGKIVVDCSSIDPIATKAFAKRIVALGCGYIDAPVSGGEVGAKAASLTIMCGGDEGTFERVKPLLDKMGKNVTLVGGVGDGQVCKVANQIIVALNIAAVGEALLFASKAGADPAKVRQALMGGFASSRILEVHGERMIKRTFAGSAPALEANTSASPTAAMLSATMIWLATLQTWPSPTLPTSVMFLPIFSNSGLARSKAASGPPTMIVSDAALAPTSPPETGASR